MMLVSYFSNKSLHYFTTAKYMYMQFYSGEIEKEERISHLER